jgi:hypothetical protein
LVTVAGLMGGSRRGIQRQIANCIFFGASNLIGQPIQFNFNRFSGAKSPF